MSELPKSWIELEIESILEPLENGRVIQQGWSPQCERIPSESKEEWAVLKTTAIQDGYFLAEENKKLPDSLEPRPHIEVKPNDILMTCAGPRNRCGVTCFVKETRPKLMMSGKMYRFRADPKKMDSKYLEAFLLSQEARVQIDRMKTGINDSGLNLTHSRFLKLKTTLAPLNEQKRIVGKIEALFSELDKGIESLKTACAQLKIYRQAVLKHAFEGKLTQQWREDNNDKLETTDQLLERIKHVREDHSKNVKSRRLKDPRSFDDGDFSWLSELPEGWEWNRLGWITCGVEYGTSAKSAKTGKIPVLRMGNIQNAKFDWTDLVFTSDPEEIKKYTLKEGDVLFNRTNSPELVGKTAIYRGEQPALFAGYLIRVNQIESIVDSQFLNLFLNSHVAKQYGNIVKTDGVNQSNINGEKLINYPFPYCSLEEQKIIVEILDEKISQIDKMEGEIVIQLQKAEALRQSILKKAFSGKLVTQDPNDEPASVLLKRIKAEKNDTKGKKRSAA